MEQAVQQGMIAYYERKLEDAKYCHVLTDQKKIGEIFMRTLGWKKILVHKKITCYRAEMTIDKVEGVLGHTFEVEWVGN